MPAIKHNMSSGKNGNKNASPKNNLPLLFKTSSYFVAVSLPVTHTTTFCPRVLPSKKEEYEPSNIPIEQYTEPQNGPYTTVPANAIIAAGTGNIITCNAWIRMYMNIPLLPVETINRLKLFTDLNIYNIFVMLRIWYSKNTNNSNTFTIIVILHILTNWNLTKTNDNIVVIIVTAKMTIFKAIL